MLDFSLPAYTGAKQDWVKRPISGMERVTYVQEWVQSDIESVVRAAGFKIIISRPFERKGGPLPATQHSRTHMTLYWLGSS